MNIRDRLMSRASVAAMAVFAPDGLPPGAERVDEGAAPGGDGGGDMDVLSPEEQAQFDAMRGDGPTDRGNVDPAGDGGGDDGDPDADDDPDADGGAGDVPDGADAGRDAADAGARDRPDAPEKRTPKTINYGRHQKELAKAAKEREDLQARLAAAEKERNEERERRTRLDERTKLLLEAINTKQPAAAAPAPQAEDKDPEPDADADPLGHTQWQNRQLLARLERLESGNTRQQEQQAATNAEQELYGNFSASLEQAARSDPEFADAFVHLRETRFRELGYIYADIDITDADQCAMLTPQQQTQLSKQIQQAFYNEQLMVADGAIKAGKNPAGVVKNLARARGFTPKPAAPAGDPPPAAGDPPTRRGAPPARRQAEAPPSVTEQLEQVRANQRDAKSLSDAGGAPGGEMTMDRLADMPQDEFEQFLAQNKGRMDRMMGKSPM